MKLASTEEIKEIRPIEGADKIELAIIQGWQSVIKKGSFKVGDKVIFIPIDTVVQPREWNKFLWDKNDPHKPIRIKTLKLLNTISQGLIISRSVVGEAFCWGLGESDEDLPSILGISKYEKPIAPHLSGKVKGDFPTHLLSKTDEDNLASNIAVLEELRECDRIEITMKCDGSSATFYKKDGVFGVCSRNQELLDDGENSFWKIAHKYDLPNLLPDNTALQGELCGEGVNKNRMKLKGHHLFIFNRKNLLTNEYEDVYILPHPDLKPVSFVAILRGDDVKNLAFDSLQKMANDLTYSDNVPAEGIVIRGFKNGRLSKSKILGKMLSVKIINQNYKD